MTWATRQTCPVVVFVSHAMSYLVFVFLIDNPADELS